MYYFEEDIAKETKAAGLRGVLGQTVIQFPVADAKTPADGLARAERSQRVQGDPLITPAVAPHAMYTLDGPTLKAARDLSKRYDVPTLIHLSETRDEVKTAAALTHPRWHIWTPGLWPGVLAAHGVWVSEAESGSAVARRRRVAQPRKQHEAGERHRACHRPGGRGGGWPGHGRRRQQQRSRHVRGDADRIAPSQAGDLRSPRRGAATALEMATIGGARALGMESRSARSNRANAPTSSSSDGAARQTPMYDPVSHLVYTTRGDDVRTRSSTAGC